MNPKKPSRRKTNASKLEPIDWREFANDAVLNGNMSTLYRRPPSEDASAYASPEAMIEIEKRVTRSVPDPGVVPGDSEVPTVGPHLTVSSPPAEASAPSEGASPPVGLVPPADSTAGPPAPTVGLIHTVGTQLGDRQVSGEHPTVGKKPTAPSIPPKEATGSIVKPTVGTTPTAGTIPAEAAKPTVGTKKDKKVKPIRTVHDALTLAGQVLYGAMLGAASQASTTSCTKGYRQLAAETHLDKDTVRDLIVEFKQKGIVRETATYDPDTRLSKTYDVLSHEAVLNGWRQAGILFVTAGRQRPLFCGPDGTLLKFIPTVGMKPTVNT